MKKSILRQPFSFRNKIFFNLLLFLGFSAIIGLSGLYIFLVNSEVKEKYGLREYEKKLSENSKKKEKMEFRFSNNYISRGGYFLPLFLSPNNPSRLLCSYGKGSAKIISAITGFAGKY